MVVLLSLLAFLFAALLVSGFALAFSSGDAAAIQRRLGELADLSGRELDPNREGPFMRSMKWLGQMSPKSPSEMGKLRLRLVTAGYRANEALIVFCGIRVAVALGFFTLFATRIFFRPNFFAAIALCFIGYLIPGFFLARMAKRRQHRIRLGLPDALDLLVVSVEAGLGLDQAIQRVGEELATIHPDLSDELRLVNLELRAGKGRAEAMHNLSGRTGVDDVTSLVAMLVQTDKFGTSITQSLRVHSETLRTKRRQRAEEAAAKTGVKMVFPLVFCIFPAIWVVTIGPAAIKFVQILFPLAEKMK
jgi:tight adherence protein C